MIFLCVSVGSQCNTEGKFGWQCKFDCRCKNGEDCDKVTGQCDSGCQRGRYGIGCQFGKSGWQFFNSWFKLKP